MTQPASKSAKSSWLKNILIVSAVALVCFFLGGGWHFFNPNDDLLYGLNYKAESPSEIDFANRSIFLFCGPAASLLGAVATTLFIIVRQKQAKKRERN
jgi:hypothetical protein